MSKINLKKDFKDGDPLYGEDLNNNFGVIEAAYEKTTEDYEDISADVASRQWQESNTPVSFYKGTTNQVNSRNIIEGQILYDVETGRNYLDANGERVSTGASTVINSMDGVETNLAPSVKAVKTFTNNKITTDMTVDTKEQAPSVTTIKNYVANNFQTKGEILWTNENPSDAFKAQSLTLSLNKYSYYGVVYLNKTTENLCYNTGKIPKGRAFRMFDIYVSSGSKIGACSRNVTYTNETTLTFEDAQYYTITANSLQTDNTRLIPLFVIGYNEI
jgi:hypothetical protein